MADVDFDTSLRVGGDANFNKRKRNAFDTGNTPSRRTARSNNAAQQFARDPAADFLSADATGDDQPFDLAQALQQETTDADGNGLGGHHNGDHGSKGDPNNSSVDAAAAALAHNYSMTVPPHPGDGFGSVPTVGGDASFNPDGTELDDSTMGGGNNPNNNGTPGRGGQSGGNKPAVGSDEWHKVRKDNHKEVERRRRETINEGINELAKIVPGCEKNKGSILARAVQYIQKLQDDASSNIDKWTFEKLVTEQAISEITAKCNRAFQERNAWKRLAAEAGIDVESADLGLGPEDGDGADDNEEALQQRKEAVEASAQQEVQRRKAMREEAQAAALAGSHRGQDVDGDGLDED